MARKIDSLSVSVIILTIFAAVIVLMGKGKTMLLPDADKPCLPVRLGEWKLSQEIKIPAEFLNILGTKTAVLGEYMREDLPEKFQLYILKSTGRRSSIHQPEYCYLGSGKNEIVQKGAMKIQLNEHKFVPVNYFILQISGGFELVSYFYSVNKTITNNYYLQQLNFLFNRLKNKPVEGSLVRIAKLYQGNNLEKELDLLQDIMRAAVMEIILQK